MYIIKLIEKNGVYIQNSKVQHLDVTKLERYDKSFLEGIEDEENMWLDIKKLYNKNRSLKLTKVEKK